MKELCGRDAELTALERFLDAASAGPAGLLLEGDAGIGKTALWQAALERARARSYRILSCRPVASETQLPFAALGDLLGDLPDELLTALPEPQGRALEIALLRAEAGDVPLHRLAVSRALLGVLRLVGGRGATLVALDDIQWLDASSAAALEFALRRLETEPVAVLATRRTPDGGASPETVLALPEERLERLHVGPLELGPLERVLVERFGTRFLRPTLVRIHRAAAGNPFYALEIAHALLRTGAPLGPGEALPVPSSLRELVSARIGQLSPAARDAALVASALSDPRPTLVEAALDRRGGLADAVDAGVVEIEHGRIRFTHPLLAATIYWETSVVRRRKLHGRLAGIVADTEERARHLALATDVPDPDVAAQLDDAARRAAARGAPLAAAELAEQARKLTPTGDAEGLRQRGIGAAVHLLEAGNTGRARALLEDVAAASAQGSGRAAAHVKLGVVCWYEGDPASSQQYFEAALAESEDVAELRAAAAEGVAWCSYVRYDLRGAASHARRAVLACAELEDEVATAQAETVDAYFQFMLGHGVREAALVRATELEPRIEQLARILGQPTYTLSAIRKWTGALDAARAGFEALYARDLERGDDHYLPLLLAELSHLECLSGNWSRAAEHADEGYAIALRTGQELGQLRCLACRAQLEVLGGRAAAARTLAHEALALPMSAHSAAADLWVRPVLGFLALTLGDPAEARRVLEPARLRLQAAGFGEPAVLRFLPDEVEALVAVGELEQAEVVLEPFEACGRALGRDLALATSARCRGLLVAARGDLLGASAAVEQALEHHARVPEPFEAARTLLVLGALLRRRKQKRAAREHLGRALEIFDELWAPPWSDRVRSELARVGGRPQAAESLTPTEQRIVELVAAGRTNREVAGELYLSVKTVETKLSRIYRTLHVRSRSELAGRVAGGPRPPL